MSTHTSTWPPQTNPLIGVDKDRPGQTLLSWVHPAKLNAAKDFIRSVYFKEHRATVFCHYERLLALTTDAGRFKSVVGLRRADEARLMVEDYLRMPVEQALMERFSDKTSLSLSRQSIMEIGSLASSDPGAGRKLMLSLVLVLEALNVQWLVVTASRGVRNGLARLGIEMTFLTGAKQGLLHSPDNWGSYYDNNPQVVAIRPLREALRLKTDPFGKRLLQRAIRLDAAASRHMVPFPIGHVELMEPEAS